MAKTHRYAALVRGINVGGRAVVTMAALREACEAAGCADVATYIQSGNVLLTSGGGRDELRERLEQVLAERLGISPTVVLRTGAELATVVAENPFPDVDPGRLHVAFLPRRLERDEAESASAVAVPPERLSVRGADVYLSLPNGMGRAKTPVALERRLPVPMTVRNWRTVTKLAELLGA